MKKVNPEYYAEFERECEIGDKILDWFTKRCEYTMAGETGRAGFIDRYILFPLRRQEKTSQRRQIRLLGL